MSSVQRGFFWIFLFGTAICLGLLGGASVLWSAGDGAIQKSNRYTALAARKEAVIEHRDTLRRYHKTTHKAYVAAASAAQAEAALREELSHILREAGGEVSAIRTQPLERRDAQNRLRLQVVLNAPQAALEPILSALAKNDPMIVVDKSDIRIAGGIRRPGAAISTERYLTISLGVSALWKEAGNG